MSPTLSVPPSLPPSLPLSLSRSESSSKVWCVSQERGGSSSENVYSQFYWHSWGKWRFVSLLLFHRLSLYLSLHLWSLSLSLPQIGHHLSPQPFLVSLNLSLQLLPLLPSLWLLSLLLPQPKYVHYTALGFIHTDRPRIDPMYILWLAHITHSINSVYPCIVSQPCLPVDYVNPRCACAARVVVLCVCLSVCLSVCLLLTLGAYAQRGLQ